MKCSNNPSHTISFIATLVASVRTQCEGGKGDEHQTRHFHDAGGRLAACTGSVRKMNKGKRPLEDFVWKEGCLGKNP